VGLLIHVHSSIICSSSTHCVLNVKVLVTSHYTATCFGCSNCLHQGKFMLQTETPRYKTLHCWNNFNLKNLIQCEPINKVNCCADWDELLKFSFAANHSQCRVPRFERDCSRCCCHTCRHPLLLPGLMWCRGHDRSGSPVRPAH